MDIGVTPNISKGVTDMSKEREILQRFQTGMSQRSIALGLHVSRNTVAKVIAAYKSNNVSKEVINAVDDDELHRRLYPSDMTFQLEVVRPSMVKYKYSQAHFIYRRHRMVYRLR